MRKLSLIAALISAFSLHSVFAEDTSIDSSKMQLVEKAVLAYICIDEDKHCDKGVFKGHAQVTKIFGRYAKVMVLPDAEIDPEWVYLEKNKTGWDVLAGIGVNPMELGIPKEVW